MYVGAQCQRQLNLSTIHHLAELGIYIRQPSLLCPWVTLLQSEAKCFIWMRFARSVDWLRDCTFYLGCYLDTGATELVSS